MLRSSRPAISRQLEPLSSPDILIRRSVLLLYLVGIVSSQVAAHVGAFPVARLRLFEILGVVALIGLLCWVLTRDRYGHSGLVALSMGGTLLVAAAVGLSGGTASPLWVLYFFPVIFNGLYFGRGIAWAALAGIIVLSALPAMIEGDHRRLLVQLLIVAPTSIALTEMAITLVNGLQGAAQLQAVTVEERVRHAETERRSDQLEAIYTVTQQLTRLIDANAIAATIIDQTHRVIPSNSARVYVREGNELVPIAFRGTGEYAFETNDVLKVRVGEGITGWVAQHAQSLIIDDARADPRATPILGTPAVEESMLVAPLVYEDEVLGVLVLVTLGRCQFAESDLRLLMILAGQAANALANAHLLAATRQRADTDGLTGLLNHRAVHEQLMRQLERVRLEGQPLSVVMLDVDGFKRVNDGYGHPSGDAVLHQVANLLCTVCRPDDLVARYGGDEFMLVLPNMAAPEADRLADRIVDLAARHIVVVNDGSHLDIEVHMSAGVATCPADGMTAAELAAAADARLYTAKKVGQ